VSREVVVRVLRLVTIALLGAVGGLAAISLAPPARRTVGPGELSMRAFPSAQGTSSLALPPLGEVRAATHAAPLRIELRVDRIDVESLESVLDADEPEETLRGDVERDLGPLLRAFALRTIAAALVGGVVTGALLPRRAAHRVALAGGSAVVVAAALLGWSWASYDSKGFDHAQFTGPLERAPAILDAAQRQIDGLADVRDRVKVLSEQLSGIYAAVERDPVKVDTTILHVSDIHSNPLGVEIVTQLARAFDVDAVLDTGDLTSFGNPVEGRITELLDDVPAPYYFVAGNHDSAANRDAIAATPGVTVLDGTSVDIGDVRVLGFADPTFTADGSISAAEGDRRRLARAGLVADQVRRTGPDVLAVHDLRLASESPGAVPVIVSGHAHERKQRVVDGTLELVVGSTGATGLGAFTVQTGMPYEAELLRFRGRRLVAVDYVTLDGVSGEFRVDRRLVRDLVEPLPAVTRTGPS
jgi:predicted phosphodiesterase